MLKNKKIIIVGGSSGIGLSVAKSLSAEKAKVIIASSNSETLELAQKQLPNSVSAVQVDATNECSVNTFFNTVGTFDHLIVTIKPQHFNHRIKQSITTDARLAFDTKFWGAIQSNKTMLKQYF